MDGARLLTLVQGSIPINGNHNLAFLRTSGIFILPADDWAAMAAVIYMFLIYYLMEDGASLKIWVQASIQRAMSRALLRSEEHTSELQSRQYLVCRLLLEKKKQTA